ncbi:uncharacterized protein LOC114657686 [Erpetoichthys calabaricus]|uniref:uncharacterized protein LOC114657686 n=1 Tax=Erpetoichthys calabaricus TaxID=27687 RepID=UPI002234CF2D|nr:uncharacterized protein LOC114657686 [Erpetoichthys calabaricus]
MLNLMVCPAGRVCIEGLDKEPPRATNLCPAGFYCPQGNVVPHPRSCPNGTYNDHQGLRDATECTPCPTGYFCYSDKEQGIANPTGPCPSGYFCPPGTAHPYSFPCPIGSYWNSSLGQGGDTCLPCPAGFYCKSIATETPAVCPHGFFCPQVEDSAEELA